MSLALHYWMRGAHHCSGPPISKMTYTVSNGTLYSTIPYRCFIGEQYTVFWNSYYLISSVMCCGRRYCQTYLPVWCSSCQPTCHDETSCIVTSLRILLSYILAFTENIIIQKSCSCPSVSLSVTQSCPDEKA